ncbi:Conserved hypothetical protein [Candidatus Protochlamydia naegleriophila]|uniref:Uncharacterized protein n=1 Tax=Candidatus Protochlamydia naegleriophila TaxID=389348 RepID=A0A0U5ESU6_9BACT|nr:hypothetical protein [Candidatus Protochlamydia naegleriophila]CUI17315.1 Conserved hypothetical protein [Candidatus Protochlamydia naegleriophila]
MNGMPSNSSSYPHFTAEQHLAFQVNSTPPQSVDSAYTRAAEKPLIVHQHFYPEPPNTAPFIQKLLELNIYLVERMNQLEVDNQELKKTLISLTTQNELLNQHIAKIQSTSTEAFGEFFEL